MKKVFQISSVLRTSLLVLLLLIRSKSFAQSGTDEDVPDKPQRMRPIERFQFGLYLGTYFANSYTANVYDGYGYDIYGLRNDFTNSFLNRAIYYNSGINGQKDNIAQQLGVQPGEWSFGESDMPVNLTYNVAFAVGFNGRICINRRDAIIFNVNASRINASGNFTITLTNPNPNAQAPGYVNYKTFNITGREQRLMFQVGLQRLLGDIGKFNLFIEGGLTSTLAKYDNNVIVINKLTVDLASFYNQAGVVSYRPSILTGIGLGAFGGIGVNMTANRNTVVQLVYNPTYETIKIGADPKLALQQYIGLRVYGHL